jgi:hypothetical protein
MAWRWGTGTPSMRCVEGALSAPLTDVSFLFQSLCLNGAPPAFLTSAVVTTTFRGLSSDRSTTVFSSFCGGCARDVVDAFFGGGGGASPRAARARSSRCLYVDSPSSATQRSHAARPLAQAFAAFEAAFDEGRCWAMACNASARKQWAGTQSPSKSMAKSAYWTTPRFMSSAASAAQSSSATSNFLRSLLPPESASRVWSLSLSCSIVSAIVIDRRGGGVRLPISAERSRKLLESTERSREVMSYMTTCREPSAGPKYVHNSRFFSRARAR